MKALIRHTGYLLAAWFLCLCSIARAQQDTLTLPVVLEAMRQNGEVHCQGIGEAGATSDQYGRYLWMCDHARPQELISLAQDANPVLRCYAFQCLVSRGSPEQFRILLDHLRDNQEVVHYCGCVRGSKRVGDFFAETWENAQQRSLTSRPDSNQKRQFDSILVFTPGISLATREKLLRRLEPLPKYHDRIRQIVTEEHSEAVLPVLARFRDSSDVPLIRDFLGAEVPSDAVIEAVRNYPQASFHLDLCMIFESEWQKPTYNLARWRLIYQALARYPNGRTLAFFNRTIKTTDPYRYQTLGTYLLLAITQYPDPLFDPLKKEIQLDDLHYREFQMSLLNFNK